MSSGNSENQFGPDNGESHDGGSPTDDPEQTVFIIDDDEAVRDSLKALVDIRRKKVQTFASGEDFLAAYADDTPGCVVTDLRIIDGMSGLELQVEISRRGYQIPVIVISAYADVSNAVEAMHNGAVTLLEKNCSTEMVWENIIDALSRDRKIRAGRQKTAKLMDRFSQLTRDEIGVMKCIIDGTLNKNIATDLAISLRTVESRRQNVLKKVGVASVQELVRVYVELEQAIGSDPGETLLENAK